MKNKNLRFEEVKLDKSKRNIWFRMVAYFRTALPLLILAMFLALVIILADLINPYITKIIIDDYIGGKNPLVNIYFLGGLYLLCSITGAATQYFQVNILNYMGQTIIHKIRLQVFSHVQNMSLKFFDKNSTGSLLTRITNDIEAISELYSGVIIDLFKDVFMIAGIVIAMLLLNWRIALVSFCIIPLIVFATVLFNKKAKENFRWARSLIARINAFFAENISGMKLVQIFNKQKEKFGEYKKINDEYNKATVTGVRLNAIFRPANEFINSLAISILIWFCAGDIIRGTLDFGVLYAFITYSRRFFHPINDLADKFATIQSGRVSAERIFELLDNCEHSESSDSGKSLAKAEIKGGIEFRNVWFAYNGEEYILKDVSFKINAGETAAFVGATGSGKSTIINLMGRFYDIQKGEILLDGVNIKEYRLDELRKSIAVVMQDVFLFAGDIKSNIRLNNSDISDAQVEEAAKYVNADYFIRDLNQKYNEPVMERGATLSAGQRQLLSFARAVAFNPPLLVLDEATASIDTENEEIIQESLKKISKDRTTVIIAHRLSTIKNADIIIVIHQGVITESGKHEELLQNGGIYRKLYEIQFA
ncbi:MAG: ABC transporter ATP-binding protein/permease [Oscillospiraceae bacterium]|nr:ABC transporter ATP-binding protein/permease [Oscillospiraceae bacterium]